jgi:hypothetical protein
MKALLSILVLALTPTLAAAGPWHGYSHGYGYGWGHRYVPSTYMEWNDALQLGKQQLAEQQKSLGEIAQEYRARKAQERASSPDHSQSSPAKDATPPVCPPPNG